MPSITPYVRRAGALSGMLALLAAAACTDRSEVTAPSARSIDPGAASLSRSPELNDAQGRHIMHTRQWFENDASRNAGGHKTTSTGIFYHGGPVLQSGTRVVAVYWASSPIFAGGPAVGTTGTGSQDGSLVGTFLRNVGGSSYFNINSTYTDGSGLNIAKSVTYTGFWANGTNAPSGTTSISDSQMIAMLQSGFTSGALTYDASTLYAIFTSGKVNLGGGFGTQYCAYHTHGTVSINGVSKTVLYAAMPYDYAYPSACTSGFAPANGSLDPGADYEVNTLGHETEETTTDMLGTAWYDNRGYENADKCAWTWGTTYPTAGGTANMNLGGTDFLVQQNWVNAGRGGCALSYP
jgi:hypothetical protein